MSVLIRRRDRRADDALFPASPHPARGGGAGPVPRDRHPAEAEPARHVGPAWGWKGVGAGRAAHVEAGALFQATTVQACGLYPFVQGSGAPREGIPVGRHMLTGETVCLELLSWQQAGLTTNTGALLLGQPGVGKSAIVKRMATGSTAIGIPFFNPGDVKGEYASLTQHLEGQVVRVGRGLTRINPLAGGALAQAAQLASGETRQALLDESNARRLACLTALATVVRKDKPITEGENVVLAEAVNLLVDRDPGVDPTIPDVLAAINEAPEHLRGVVYATDEAGYREETKNIAWTLTRLCGRGGELSGIFDGQSTTRLDFSGPVNVDISAIAAQSDDVVAAAMICSWAWGFGQLDAQAALGLSTNRLIIMDEMWRCLRAAPGLVEKADSLTRLNRAMGVATLMVTHTLQDLESLATEADRSKARGFIDRCGVTIMGALPKRELAKVSEVAPLTSAEVDLVSGWSAPPSWTVGVRHPGRGKYLIKTGERLGIPIALAFVGNEHTLYDTDQAVRHRTHDDRHRPPTEHTTVFREQATLPLLEEADRAVQALARAEEAAIAEAEATVAHVAETTTGPKPGTGDDTATRDHA